MGSHSCPPQQQEIHADAISSVAFISAPFLTYWEFEEVCTLECVWAGKRYRGKETDLRLNYVKGAHGKWVQNPVKLPTFQRESYTFSYTFILQE